jgi:hypothetical protein
MEYKKRGPRPKTIKKYYDCFNDIQFQLRVNESVSLSEITRKHEVSNFVVTALIKTKAIEITTKGYRWIASEPMPNIIANVLTFVSEYNKQKAIYKRSIGLNSEPELNESEYLTNQPEAIFTVNKPVKTEITHVVNDRTFEISMFGFSILKIKR